MFGHKNKISRKISLSCDFEAPDQKKWLLIFESDNEIKISKCIETSMFIFFILIILRLILTYQGNFLNNGIYRQLQFSGQKSLAVPLAEPAQITAPWPGFQMRPLVLSVCFLILHYPLSVT